MAQVDNKDHREELKRIRDKVRGRAIQPPTPEM